MSNTSAGPGERPWPHGGTQALVADRQPQGVVELVAVREYKPALLFGQWSPSTSLRALARTGVPTAKASSASSDRLSYGEGTTTTVAASEARH